MKLSYFRYSLPPELIALYPFKNRDESRLMIIHKSTGKIEHKFFKDLVNYFSEGDVLVLNNTKVFPSVLYGSKEKTGAKIEVFLLRELSKKLCLWDTLVEPARKIRVGNKLFFGEGDLIAEVLDNTTSRGRTIKFLFDGTQEEFYNKINKLGTVPLPTNIRRNIEDKDKERYQTVYAEKEGAVAAPSAGMHFTKYLLKKIEVNGVNICYITLHIGLGMLSTVDVEDLTKYRVNSERFEIINKTSFIINKALDLKNKICGVGISSVKALESSISACSRLKSEKNWTNKFIFPPYQFKICNSIITNFHLPGSTLLITTSAFGGYDVIMKAYEIAIKEKYRFFVYGDAMMII